jgi:hypothetical protein
MTRQLIKFMYIRSKFTITSFLQELLAKLEIDRSIYLEHIKKIATYPAKNKSDEFGLRLEVSSNIFNERLLQKCHKTANEKFPYITLRSDKIVFVPPATSNEQFIICDMKEYSPYQGRVIKITNSSRYSWVDFLVWFDERGLQIEFLAMSPHNVLVCFKTEMQTGRAVRYLLADNNNLYYPSIYLAAQGGVVKTQEYSNDLTITTNLQAIPVSSTTTNNDSSEIESSKINLEQLMGEIQALKDKLNVEKKSSETQTDPKSIMKKKAEVRTLTRQASSTSSSSCNSSESLRTNVNRRVKFAREPKKKAMKAIK